MLDPTEGHRLGDLAVQSLLVRAWWQIDHAVVLILRGVAQPGSASALGAEGREFESRRPDHIKQGLTEIDL